ncbi:hypothetical protein ABEF83_07940 [Acinetobacter thermotolerans]|uniref:hypothetical protein n=1 Tax=Acinetobacter thermotolerans TaxID=3151487 RepID=UPI00325AEB86
MKLLEKSKTALSVLRAESEILMYEITPHNWSVLSILIDQLEAHLSDLEMEYSEDDQK